MIGRTNALAAGCGKLKSASGTTSLVAYTANNKSWTAAVVDGLDFTPMYVVVSAGINEISLQNTLAARVFFDNNETPINATSYYISENATGLSDAAIYDYLGACETRKGGFSVPNMEYTSSEIGKTRYWLAWGF